MNKEGELALAFCREVMGWRQPVDRRYGDREKDPLGNPSKVWTPYVFDHDQKHPQFHYTELNAVMPLVTGWCEEHGLQLYIHKFPGVPYRVRITTFPRPDCVEEAEDLTVALMTACLCAARALRADA